MAEQVVDIRERIEKMRTQIIDKPNDKAQVSSLESSNTSNVIKKPEKFSEDKKNDLQKMNKKGSSKTFTKIDSLDSKIAKSSSRQSNAEREFKEEMVKESLKSENVKDFKENIDEKVEKVEKVSTKSYKNYHLNNTVDSDEKPMELDDKSQPFPQFSLNVNNPISWKLMLLIMLMQLLTNIMLVVVLYLK